MRKVIAQGKLDEAVRDHAVLHAVGASMTCDTGVSRADEP
jgi:hypothetical protein